MNRRTPQKQSRKRLGISSFKKDWRGERIGVLGGLRELILAILCGIMPWWFGANDPPALYVISLLIMALGILTLMDSAVSDRLRGLSWYAILGVLPVLGLGLIAVFGAIQWVEISPEWLSKLSPARFALWKSWGGGESIVIASSTESYTQPARLAWLDAEVYESVVWLGSLWVLAVSVMRLPGRWGPIKRHGLVMAISALLMGIQSMLQAMTFTGKVLWIRQAGIVISSAGPFFVHSHLAAYLNMGLGFALAHMVFSRWDSVQVEEQEESLFADDRSGAGRGFLQIYVSAILMVSVMATRSRGGMLAMVIGCSVLGLVIIKAAGRMRKISMGQSGWHWLIGFAVVLSIGLTMLTDVFSVFSKSRGVTGSAVGHSAGIRRQVWGLAWRTWLQSPLWGTGWGSFVWSSQTGYRPSVDHNTHAESDYVQVLTEGGIIGSILVMLTIFGLIWSCGRLVRRLERPNHFALVGGALFGLVAVAWGSLTENNLRTAGVAIPALVTAAHLVRLSKGWKWFEIKMSQEVAESTKIGFTGRAVGVIASALMVFVAWFGLIETKMINQVWTILRPAGVHQAGTDLIGWVPSDLPEPVVEDRRLALALAEQMAPGWGDYNIQRAIIELDAYQKRTKQALQLEGIPEKDAQSQSQVLQVAVLLRDLPEADRLATKRELLSHPLIRNHLVVASSSLAKAWKEQPSAALVHLEIATLNWLYESGQTPAVSLQRALSLAGDRVDVLLGTGQAAIALGEESIAIESFARCLEVPDTTPEITVTDVAPWVTPDIVDKLTDKIPRVAVRAAESLIPVEDTVRRRLAGDRALEKLRGLGNAADQEAAYLRARALWLTGDQNEALIQMKLAVALNPQDKETRIRQVNWLISSGKTAKALEEAQVMSYFWPKDPVVMDLINKAADADSAAPTSSTKGVKGG